jgi:hypothetical protein
MSDYIFEAYCDICKRGSDALESEEAAAAWRSDHFDAEHPNNPMKKANCRIKRKVA